MEKLVFFSGSPAVTANKFSNSRGQWQLVQSKNGNIDKYSFSKGMSWTNSKSVTQEQKVGLSVSISGKAVFFSGSVTTTVTSSYENSWSQTVSNSETITVTQACEAQCTDPLPGPATGWKLFQWTLQGTEADSGRSLTTFTCNYKCIPNTHKDPQCPLNCCDPTDKYCQRCVSPSSPNYCFVTGKATSE